MEALYLVCGARKPQLKRNPLYGRSIPTGIHANPMIDPSNPVIAFCVQGMALEGTPAEAQRLFEAAWAARTDDYDAAIAAHFLARHQPTPQATLQWNETALRHAEAVTDGRVLSFMASLYLNLAAAHSGLGQRTPAQHAIRRGAAHLSSLPPGGYRDFVTMGIRRLAQDLGVGDVLAAAI